MNKKQIEEVLLSHGLSSRRSDRIARDLAGRLRSEEKETEEKDIAEVVKEE